MGIFGKWKNPTNTIKYYRSGRPEVFWKYVAHLQENTHAEVRFQ